MEKKKKKMRTAKETSGTTLNASTFVLQKSWKEKKQKGPEKIYEEITDENFPNMGKQIANQVQEAESFGQETPKEEHTETDSNQK